jgi:integrase
MRLTALGVQRLKKPGKYNDGRGLYLRVADEHRRTWVFRYSFGGKERFMGLGRFGDVSLAEARDLAQAARRLLARGKDPIQARQAERAALAAHSAAQVAFADAAEQYIAAHEAGWRNAKHRDQWRATLATYVLPRIGSVSVAAIDKAMVHEVLTPIWTRIPETAARIRSRIESVLDYSIARGWREGPNPAIWRGNLRALLPATRKLRMVRHHAALPWREAPAFMAALRNEAGIAARALEFAILTAARSGEVRGARCDEIDLANATWTIPAPRMKGARIHRVPLSAPALELLATLSPAKADRDPRALVFPAPRSGERLGVPPLLIVVRRLGAGLTVHGFRSTFRDWCSETDRPDAAAEAALAHAVANKTVAAYARSDLFEPRRQLMDAWADFLGRAPAEVVSLAGRRDAR